jgi:hypothetical protein
MAMVEVEFVMPRVARGSGFPWTRPKRDHGAALFGFVHG